MKSVQKDIFKPLILAVLLNLIGTASISQTVGPPINVSLNENPYPIAKPIQDAIAAAALKSNRYGSAADELVQKIAKTEAVDPDQVLIGEFLGQLGTLLALKQPAEAEVIYTVPGYPALVNGAAAVGAKIVEIPLNEHLENDLAAIQKGINKHTAAIFLVNPHNPSGTLSDNNAFHQFIAEASRATTVVVDEAYLEFSDNFSTQTAVNNIKQGDDVIVFRTFGKAYGLAGLSIGYAIASKETAQYLRNKGLGNLFELNSIAVAAASAALDEQAAVTKLRTVNLTERQKWHTLLDSLDLQHTDSKANFIYFDSRFPHQKLFDFLAQRHIHIGKKFEPYHNWVRISIGTPEENELVRAAVIAFYKEQPSAY